MGFKKFMQNMGMAAPSVDTVLASPDTRPGGAVTGVVRVVGGQAPLDVNGIYVGLQARVEVESGDHEWKQDVVFHRQQVTGAGQLQPGQHYEFPFDLHVPWQAPITAVQGWHLRGMQVGVRTEVDARGRDGGDLDPVVIHPLPEQLAVLQALGEMGFRFISADLEAGRLGGSVLPFYQEIEFAPSGQYRRHFSELEVTFLANGDGVDVVFEADRRGGLMSSGGDALGRARMPWGGDVRVARALCEDLLARLARGRGWR